MGLVDVALLAAVQGAAEGLPVSASGHVAVARLWLDGGQCDGWLDGPLSIATAAALAFAVRQRLWEAAGEGVRAIARPALFKTSPPARDAALLTLGAAVSLIVAAVVGPYVETWAQAPLAVGLGLLATGVALASTAAQKLTDAGRAAEGDGRRPGVPFIQGDCAPSAAGMAAAAVAHGLSAAPGGSRVGAALVVLLWLGVRPTRAADLALALTIPALLARGARALSAPLGPAPDAGLIAASALITFVSAALAAALLRALCERRRPGALALWVIPLGLATVAYARALPGGA